MICPDDISNIRAELDKNIGQKIMIKGTQGRRRFFEQKAIIENTYPQVFRVKSEGKEFNGSYKYTEILTNELQISIFDGKEYLPLVPTILKEKF